jgi:hypothetical protein
LGQLVKAGTPQEAPYSRDTWIVPELVVSKPFRAECRVLFQEFPHHPIRIRNHAAELQAIESFAVTANAPVTEDNGTAFPTQQYYDGQNQGQKDQPENGRPYDVHNAFQGFPDGAGSDESS